MTLETIVAQIPVTLEPERNLAAIAGVMEQAEPDTLLLFPEGALSGYDEPLSFLTDLDPRRVDTALVELRDLARERRLHLVVSTLLKEHGNWYIVAIYAGPRGESWIYRKINLAPEEREYVTPGSSLPLLSIRTERGTLTAGVQLCREVRFPEGWRALARAGAEVLLLPAWSVGPSGSSTVWRSHALTRAAENQRFLLLANAATPRTESPSAIIAPDGRFIAEEGTGATALLRATLDLSTIGHAYHREIRDDIPLIRSDDARHQPIDAAAGLIADAAGRGQA